MELILPIRTSTTRLAAAVLLAALCLLPAPASAMDKGRAVEVVDRLHAALMEVSREGVRLGFQGRYGRLEPVVTGVFDLSFIAKVALGRYWGRLGDGEQSLYVEKFRKLSVATYAYRFDDYGGEVFSPAVAEPGRRGRLVVSTELVTSKGERHAFDYLLHEKDGRWMIINVVVDGVSDLSLKRSQFTSIMEDDGFEALIRQMDEKIDDYSSGER